MCRAAAPRHVRLAVMFALALPAAGLATDRPEQDAVEQASDAAPGAATSAAIQSAGSEPTERVDQQAGSAPRAAVVQNKEAPALPQDAATLARSQAPRHSLRSGVSRKHRARPRRPHAGAPGRVPPANGAEEMS